MTLYGYEKSKNPNSRFVAPLPVAEVVGRSAVAEVVKTFGDLRCRPKLFTSSATGFLLVSRQATRASSNYFANSTICEQ